VLLATSGGAATALYLSFGDDIKSGCQAAVRTGRVASTLVLCINDYRTTLNQREGIQDAEEREIVLKACHKRCALRTLRVLEKNGGIFIKLGQHLVSPPWKLCA
jgi:aarF domain-containing kinase